MTPQDYPETVDLLCAICQTFGDRGWCRATSGNFSARIDDCHCVITQSGRDKSQLTANDLMICDFDTGAVDPACTPSAETPLHTRLYLLDDSIGAVLHTHSVTSTVLSRDAGDSIHIKGFEMQKALSGVSSHEETVAIPVFDNDQNMAALAEKVTAAWKDGLLRAPGFLIAGHGLYAWGKDLDEARRHVEGFEFLFECLWQESLVSQS
ncbi:MAG: methylthioribulose 1-phosphate dehydratase [Woeseiaceae bacterium]